MPVLDHLCKVENNSDPTIETCGAPDFIVKVLVCFPVSYSMNCLRFFK